MAVLCSHTSPIGTEESWLIVFHWESALSLALASLSQITIGCSALFGLWSPSVTAASERVTPGVSIISDGHTGEYPTLLTMCKSSFTNNKNSIHIPHTIAYMRYYPSLHV